MYKKNKLHVGADPWSALDFRADHGSAPTCELCNLFTGFCNTHRCIVAEITHAVSHLHMTQKTDDKKVKIARIAGELKISENRYRRLFETAQDGILILNAETGQIMDVNPFLIKLLGYTREQFVDKAIWEIGTFKDLVANYDKFLELQEEEYVRYEDLPLETADGRKINVEFVSNVYLEKEHKVIQCNIRDITQRRQAEVKLNESLAKYQVLFDSFPLKNGTRKYLACLTLSI